MRTRRDARERALSLCYELDVRGSSVDDLLAGLPAPPDAYATELVRGVEDHREEVDALIRKYADRWALERMPVIDRNLLRIAVFELAHRPEVPVAVAISEAVELAKRYSTDDSGRFVNGMLGRIAEAVRDPGGSKSPGRKKA
ncbi:MAG: transcription antitermination factor NusB [Actinomycetota bacterium]|nr:transcription antitermination factor NusB [Actinomycetota bacterium]